MKKVLTKAQFKKVMDKIKSDLKKKYRTNLSIYPTNFSSCHLYNHYYHLNRNKLHNQTKDKIMIYLQKHYFINGKIRTKLQVRKQEIINELKQVKRQNNLVKLHQIRRQIKAKFKGSPNDLVIVNNHQIHSIQQSDLGRIINHQKAESDGSKYRILPQPIKDIPLNDIISNHMENGYDGTVKVKKIKK